MRFTGEEGDEEGISSIFTAGAVSPPSEMDRTVPSSNALLFRNLFATETC
jgi:hypothetical protein